MRAFLLVVLAGCSSVDQPGHSDLPRAPRSHRATASDCVEHRASPEPVITSAITSLGCSKNADCTGLGAHCVVRGNTTVCAADACTTNAQCPGVAVCECSTTANYCVADGCHVDADCGHGGYCSPSGCSSSAANDAPHYCHTTSDECLEDSECAGAGVCRYQSASKTWRCTTAGTCQ